MQSIEQYHVNNKKKIEEFIKKYFHHVNDGNFGEYEGSIQYTVGMGDGMYASELLKHNAYLKSNDNARVIKDRLKNQLDALLQEVDIDELKVRIEGIHRRYARPITNGTQQDEDRRNLDIDNNAGINSYLLNINVECPSNKLLVARDKMDKIKDDVVKGAVKDATLDVYNMVFTLRQQIPGGPLREIAKYLQPNDSDLTSALQSNYKKIGERDNEKTWKEKIAEKFTKSKSQVNIIQ